MMTVLICGVSFAALAGMGLYAMSVFNTKPGVFVAGDQRDMRKRRRSRGRDSAPHAGQPLPWKDAPVFIEPGDASDDGEYGN